MTQPLKCIGFKDAKYGEQWVVGNFEVIFKRVNGHCMVWVSPRSGKSLFQFQSVTDSDYYLQCGSNKSIFEDDDPLIFIGFFLPSASSPSYFLFLSCCSGISNLLFLPGITKDWLQKENLLMLYTKLDKNSVLGMDWCWIFVRTEIYSILFTGESERLKIKT